LVEKACGLMLSIALSQGKPEGFAEKSPGRGRDGCIHGSAVLHSTTARNCGT
jgi:hypothetical protein